MDVFHKALNEFDLSSLDYKGPRCTWCNNRKDVNFTKERLDRVTVNKDWIGRYLNMEVVVLPIRNYDNLLMHLVKMDRVVRKPKPFRFEAS